MMTEEELSAIEARATTATEGPWSDQTNGLTVGENKAIWSPHGICVGIAWHYSKSAENAAFIAHARTDIPALLAMIRSLQEDTEHDLFTIARLKREYGEDDD